MSLLKKLKFLASDAALVARKRGWLAAFQLIGQRIGTDVFLYRRCVVLCRTLPESPQTVALPNGYEIRIATKDDLSVLADLVAPDKVRLFSQRMATGRLCFVALAGTAIVSYLWLTFDTSWELDQFELQWPAKTAYLCDGLTDPKHRRQGLFIALNSLADQHAKTRDARYSLGVVDRRNKASLALYYGLGYEQIGIFVYLKVLGLEWIRRIALDPELL